MQFFHAPDHLLIINDEQTTLHSNWHQHYFMQLHLGKVQLNVETEKGERIETLVDNFIISSQVKHQVIQRSNRGITLLIDPQSQFSLFLQQHILVNNSVISDLRAFTGIEVLSDYHTLISDIKTRLNYHPEAITLDKRIEQIKAALQKNPCLKIGDAAKQVHLSPDRLSHLFTEHMRISFSGYGHYQKIQASIALLASDDKLTDIAHASGFTDSAHFSRSMQKNFGIKAKLAFKNSQYVKVDECL